MRRVGLFEAWRSNEKGLEWALYMDE